MSFRDLFGGDDGPAGSKPGTRKPDSQTGPQTDDDFQLRAEDFAEQLLRAVQGGGASESKPRADGPGPGQGSGPKAARPAPPRAPRPAAPRPAAPRPVSPQSLDDDSPPLPRMAPPPADDGPEEDFDPLAELLGKDAPKAPGPKGPAQASAKAKAGSRRRIRWKVVVPLVLTALAGFGVAVLDNTGMLGAKPKAPTLLAIPVAPGGVTESMAVPPSPAAMAPPQTMTVPNSAPSGGPANAQAPGGAPGGMSGGMSGGNPFGGRGGFNLPTAPALPPAPAPAPAPMASAPVPTPPTNTSATTPAATVQPAPAPASATPPPAPIVADLQAQLAPPPPSAGKGAGKGKNDARTPEKAPDRDMAKPDAPAVRAERGGYAIQVGTFQVAANAEGLARTLTAKGYGAYVADWTDDRGNTWKVVRVGPYPSQGQAMRQKQEMGKALALSGVVLRLR